MSQSDETAAKALENLAAIKQGEDPTDPVDIMEDEINRLYDEHDLSEHLTRLNLSWGVARWDRKNGCCYYNARLDGKQFGKRISKTRSHGSHAIVVNERILEEGSREGFLDTVRHELAHAIAYAKYGGSQKHNSNWKRMASRFGADPSSAHNKKEKTGDYIFACPNGCWSSTRKRRSKKVKRPWSRGRYCNQCGETPVSCDKNVDPETLEPGTCAVESIDWSNREEYRNHPTQSL